MEKNDVTQLLEDQINKEFFSAYLYLDISNYYQEQELDGFANWFFVQAKEEEDHAYKFLTYLQDNDVPIQLKAIAQPTRNYKELIDPLKTALAHEEFVTSSINKIYSAAKEVQDYRTCQFLDWFISEQGEEEKSARDLLGKFQRFGGDVRTLYLLNDELKSRTYTPPVTE